MRKRKRGLPLAETIESLSKSHMDLYMGKGPKLIPDGAVIRFEEITDENGTMVCVYANDRPVMLCHPEQLKKYLFPSPSLAP